MVPPGGGRGRDRGRLRGRRAVRGVAPARAGRLRGVVLPGAGRRERGGCRAAGGPVRPRSHGRAGAGGGRRAPARRSAVRLGGGALRRPAPGSGVQLPAGGGRRARTADAGSGGERRGGRGDRSAAERPGPRREQPGAAPPGQPVPLAAASRRWRTGDPPADRRADGLLLCPSHRRPQRRHRRRDPRPGPLVAGADRPPPSPGAITAPATGPPAVQRERPVSSRKAAATSAGGWPSTSIRRFRSRIRRSSMAPPRTSAIRATSGGASGRYSTAAS